MKVHLLFVVVAATLCLAQAQLTCTPYNPRTRSNTCTKNWLNHEDYAPPTGDESMFISACHIQNLPPTLLPALRTLFPEGDEQDINSVLVRPDVYTYVTQDNTNISFTYVATGAGNTNRMGFAVYNPTAHDTSSIHFVWPKLNTINDGGTGCLTAGDTYKFGPFSKDTMLIFFLDSESDIDKRFFSYFDPPYFGNPDTTECPPNGCIHGSWAYLTAENVTVFGFEDLSLGDADYNDVMFFMTYEGGMRFNDIPDYNDGVVYVCSLDTHVPTRSQSEVGCYMWGLLESTINTRSCLSFLAVPPGWIWARIDDPLALPAIAALANRWSYTNANCFLLSINETHGQGYHPDTTLCEPDEYKILTMKNGTARCLHSQCTSRFVLRAEVGLGETCTGADFCKPGTQGSITSVVPVSPIGATQFPITLNTYLRKFDGSVSVSTSVILPNDQKKKIDIMVLADFSTLSSLTGNIADSILSSWRQWPSQLSNNDLDARIGIAYYNPQSGSPYYRVTSNYELSANPPDLTYSGISLSSCPSGSSDRRRMLRAARDVMSNTGISWRSGSFKTVLLLTPCGFDEISSPSLSTSSVENGVVPIGVYTGTGDIPGSWSRLSAPLSRTFKTTTGNTAWNTVFSSSTLMNNLKSIVRDVKALILPTSTMADSFLSIPNTATTVSTSTGVGNFSYTVRWPGSVTTVPSDTSIQARVRMAGRDITTVNIAFNHAPSLNDVSYTFTGNVNQTVTFTPSDVDDNTLILIPTRLPTKGDLYYDQVVPVRARTKVTLNNALPSGIYTFTYAPYPRASGSDYANFDVSDGCETDPGTARFEISLANTPPVADDFTIYIKEDSLPIGTNGDVDFNEHIHDVDVDAGVPQTLTVQLLSLPNPSSNGALFNGATPVTIGNIPKLIKYILTQPRSGRGNVVFDYQVSDGTTQGNAISNRARVTIVIQPVPHPPVLTIEPATYSSRVGDPAVTIQGFITDDDGESVQLTAIGSTISEYAVGADNVLSDSSPSTSAPFSFYSSFKATTNKVFTLTGLTWSDTTGSNSEYIDFRAVDTNGNISNTVRVFFATVPTFPPRWTRRPLNSSYVGPFEIEQGSTLSRLFFAATDDDTAQWDKLDFALTTAPSHGTVKFKHLSGGVDQSITPSQLYSSVSAPNYIGKDGTQQWSQFYLDYTPTASYYGSDTFTFRVTDPDNHVASQVATVNINVRRKTPPESANSEIRTLEKVIGSTQIPALSTNGAGSNSNVQLTLLSINFNGGSLYLDNGNTLWAIGTNTSIVNGDTDNGVVRIYARGLHGVFSQEVGGVLQPVGNFTYRAYEPSTNLLSTSTYTGQIYITHVNSPPTSQLIERTIRKGELLNVTITASDPDADDTPATNVQAKFQSIAISSKGKFFFDKEMTRPLTSAQFDTPLDGRTFYYISDTDFSMPQSSPLATFTFIVIDSHGLASAAYDGKITVLYAGTPPSFGGSDEVTTYQETPVPMSLAAGSVTESGAIPVVRITSNPNQRGTLAACNAAGACNIITSTPAIVTSELGRVVFVPQDFDWDQDFASFTFTLTDPESNAVGQYSMKIHVLHVNKRPHIKAVNFPTTAETSQGIVVNESSWRSFDWKVWDVDSLPSTLTTSLRVAFYTTQGFELFACTQTPGAPWNSSNCEFNPAAPVAIRGDFARNAKKSIASFETTTTACPNFQTLKDGMGLIDPGCEAHFKMVFKPSIDASFTPYIAITFTAVDDYSAESTSITALIFVKAINTPPTIWSPDIVLGGQGVNNPFIRDTAGDSPTYNNPVAVDDVDSNGNIELLTIRVLDGYSGNLVWPESAPCAQVQPSEGHVYWECYDRIASFNQWLTDLRFEVTSAQRADISFTISDLGFSSDYKPSPSLNATSITSIRLTAAAAAPTGNSSTLAIAVGVAAGVGLLLLGALGFFLRKTLTPPTDDYFSAATSPLTAAPQSPLYQPQHETFTSPLYKGQ